MALQSTAPSHNWSVSHDFAFYDGGAELVTRTFCRELIPGAPLYYLAGSSTIIRGLASSDAMQILPRWTRPWNYRLITPLIPSLLARQQVVEGNLLASSYAFASSVRATGRKVVYCHSPLRQVWSGVEHYRGTGPILERVGAHMLTNRLRRADSNAAATADYFIATSKAVQGRIKQYYGRDSEVVPPPIDESVFCVTPEPVSRDYFVWAGRITEPYKRLELVLEVFANYPEHELIVVGDGRDRNRLQKAATANVRFAGWQNRDSLASYFRGAQAVIFASEDDFGLVPVEAMACGTPVIAFGAGGVLDTVEHGESGILFDTQSVQSLSAAIRDFAKTNFDSAQIARSAVQRWGRGRFLSRMSEVLEGAQA